MVNTRERCFNQLMTQAARKKNPSSPNRSRTYDRLVSSPDALPLSYRRLVGAKAIKLGSILYNASILNNILYNILYYII